MVALETVLSLNEFLAHAKTRIHWFILTYPMNGGYTYRVSVQLTGLDDEHNIVGFTRYIGNSDDEEYGRRKPKFKALKVKARDYIEDVVPHATEGLWEISR